MSFDAGLRVEVSGSDLSRMIAIGTDGVDRLVVEWAVSPEALEHGDVELARSPSGERAGVRVGNSAWTIDLGAGELIDHCTVDADPWDPGILFWGRDETAGIWSDANGPLNATLAPGVEISVLGPVEDDGGEAASGGGASHVAFPMGTTRAEMDEELKRRRADAAVAAGADVHQRLTVAFNGRESIVHDVWGTYRDGVTRLQWPPLAGPRGVLFRRSRVQSYPPQSGQTSSQGYEVQHPLLITPAGEVRVLPFEFGNRPLATMPDGRFLLPCYAPMWWDGPNEGMSVVADDGECELLQSEVGHVTPMGIVRAIDPSRVPSEDPDGYESDDAWAFASARIDNGVLTVAVEQEGREAGSSWMLARLPLNGVRCGPPEHIASGTPATDTLVRIVV